MLSWWRDKPEPEKCIWLLFATAAVLATVAVGEFGELLSLLSLRGCR